MNLSKLSHRDSTLSEQMKSGMRHVSWPDKVNFYASLLGIVCWAPCLVPLLSDLSELVNFYASPVFWYTWTSWPCSLVLVLGVVPCAPCAPCGDLASWFS